MTGREAGMGWRAHRAAAAPDDRGEPGAPAGDPPGPGMPGDRSGWGRWLVPVAVALAVAAVTAVVVALWPGPFRPEALGQALALEAVLVLLSALNYSGFLWGRRTFLELVTAQPQPPPEELARRDALFVQLILAGATLFVLWLFLGG
ncbi:hypothetical protein Tmar_1383 [Thermaerobacter marianensis DSM 12885]|uniref:Uncharacterized protein n=1 Tax=Thermaerobacter marianensis (strain ATCC 700841 / DSM 12885 / JCM 10246 / 7p75a) TaxID=644966 RepID=E6SMK4_THEM7|nr:hypothetical protein [Thermaerobacter marianensis]ADU51496.1 hypothetical protein Tmar_1383 [Thermaerobacter marianensis DSM 12885]